MKSSVIPFELSHIQRMTLRAGQHDKCDMVQGFERANNLMAFTLMIEDAPILCAGSVEILPNVAELWMVTSEDFDNFKKSSVMTITDALIPFKERYTRLQAMIRCDDERARKFVAWLGFECEGCLRKYIGGNDYYIYSWVR